MSDITVALDVDTAIHLSRYMRKRREAEQANAVDARRSADRIASRYAVEVLDRSIAAVCNSVSGAMRTQTGGTR